VNVIRVARFFWSLGKPPMAFAIFVTTYCEIIRKFSYENREKFGVGFLCTAYIPWERLWIDSNFKK